MIAARSAADDPGDGPQPGLAAGCLTPVMAQSWCPGPSDGTQPGPALARQPPLWDMGAAAHHDSSVGPKLHTGEALVIIGTPANAIQLNQKEPHP